MKRAIFATESSLQDEHFRLMANASVGFVWSLRSNLELYGYTANIEAALRNHVTVAIAPDWSPTGSDGLLSELNYAATWNTIFQRPLFDDQMLLAMATVNPAKLIHQDQRLGALKEGYLADVTYDAKVIAEMSKPGSLYWNIMKS